MGIKSTTAQSVRISSTGNDFFIEHTFLGDGSELIYAQQSFGFSAESLTIANDSNQFVLSISYDGATLDGKINAGETKCFTPTGKTSVYIKTESGSTDKARIWAS